MRVQDKPIANLETRRTERVSTEVTTSANPKPAETSVQLEQDVNITSAQNGLANVVTDAGNDPMRSPRLGTSTLVVPGEAQVKNKSLKATLQRALKSATKHFPKSGQQRGPDNAYASILAGRAEVWNAVETIVKSHTGRETAAVQDAVAELKEFATDFRDVRDEAMMPRVWNGNSAERPGLKELLQNVFDAAGMGSTTTEPLSQQHADPADFSGPPLPAAVRKSLLSEVGNDWSTVDDTLLRKEFPFADFKEALHFTNQVGALAEAQGHHPDIKLSYGKVTVELTTHDAGGLTRSDFVIAARIESDVRAKT